MNLTIQTDAPPLRLDEHGDLRVGNTRVLLDLVIHAHQDGVTPEAIVQRYDTLRLADVYAVIAYYLRHQTEVEEYLRQREQQAEEVWRKIEAVQPQPADLRERLLARKARMDNGHIVPGER